MRQRLALIVAILGLVAAPSTALAVDPTQPAYGGPLTGAQEVPAVTTTATGQGTAVISADGSTITYIITYSGLSGTVNASHIHTGAAGVAGPVILPITPGPSPMTGTLTAANFVAAGGITSFAQAVAAIRAGTTYFNLHTTANPGGEIRGQILPAGDAYFADLNGAQENPPVATSGTGKGLAVVSTDGSTVTYLITYSGLSGDRRRVAHPHRRRRDERRRHPADHARAESHERGAHGGHLHGVGNGDNVRPGHRRHQGRHDLLQPPHRGQPGWGDPRPDRGHRGCADADAHADAHASAHASAAADSRGDRAADLDRSTRDGRPGRQRGRSAPAGRSLRRSRRPRLRRASTPGRPGLSPLEHLRFCGCPLSRRSDEPRHRGPAGPSAGHRPRRARPLRGSARGTARPGPA